MHFWIKATRPWSFPASTMPVVLTAAYVFYQQQTTDLSVSWFFLPAVFVAVVCYHAGLNMISDFNDFKTGVDTKESLGYKSPLVMGVISEKQWKIVAHSILLSGTGLGFIMAISSGYHLLWMGGIGLIAGYFYHIFKKYTLGDLLIFVLFGVLIVQGTFYVLTSELSVTAVYLSIPIGLITTAILHANYTRDIVHDLQAGVKTQASLVGLRNAKIEYAILVFGGYLMVVVLVFFEILPLLCLGIFLTLPLGIINTKTIIKVSKENLTPILDLDEKTAKLQLLFTLSLSCLILISLYL